MHILSWIFIVFAAEDLRVSLALFGVLLAAMLLRRVSGSITIHLNPPKD